MSHDPAIIDIRNLAQEERSPLIFFSAFERLGIGESFVLVNDHDPTLLHERFQAGLSGRFDWEYLQEGPEVWRVRIRKVA